MEFLKSENKFSFKLDGTDIWQTDYSVSVTEKDNTLISVYDFKTGIKITNIAKKYDKFNAYEWVNYIENTADSPTGLISELYDCDCDFPMIHQSPRVWSSYIPDRKTNTPLTFITGSHALREDLKTNTFCIYPGDVHKYSPTGGRCSDGLAPFFHVHKDTDGYIFGIGWTGQWACEIERLEDSIRFRSGIEDAQFKLLPGEKFRTSSVVAMRYTGDETAGCNQWRRLIKEHFSQIGSEGRDKYGALCANVWGGMRSTSVIDRIEKIKKHNLPFEYIWMDAGWYGIDTAPTADEYGGGDDYWFDHTGDWRVSEKIHPNALKDVSEAVHDAGMKFLLWFEPERVIRTTPIAKEHPEYFLWPEDENNKSLLLDLGNPAAWDYCYETLEKMIEELRIDCYRQDFNFPPLPYWRKYDKEDRYGITEIKHINGLYRLWDTLLEKFPHMIIDNCSSGGRRIDVETLRRSIPMWRSDFQCSANHAPEGSQCHTLHYNSYMPYSGTGTGRPYDEYRIRSAYSPSIVFNHSFSEKENFIENDAQAEFLNKYTREYLWIRPFLSEDFYPLTQFCDKNDVWCAMQYDRPEEKDGVIQIFKRENAPYETASFKLRKIKADRNYQFTDLDGSEFTLSGQELCENGFRVSIIDAPKAKIYYYKEI